MVEFVVATRSKRLADYAAHSQHASYPAARVEQLRQSGQHYDAQIFAGEPFTQQTLVFTNPKIKGLVNPYERLGRLFETLCDESTFRCLVVRPSPSLGNPDPRVYLFAFSFHFRHVHSTVHAVDLRRDADVVRCYNIRYTGSGDPPYRFEESEEFIYPLRAGRTEGIYVADVAEKFNLYFGYAESAASESQFIVDQVRVDTRNLYAL